jgi:hypothetical protein
MAIKIQVQWGNLQAYSTTGCCKILNIKIRKEPKMEGEKQAEECKKSLDGVLRIIQYIDGSWVTLMNLEMAQPAKKFEDITGAVSEIVKLIHDSTSVYLTNSDGDSIIVMKSQGPVKVQFVPNITINV